MVNIMREVSAENTQARRRPPKGMAGKTWSRRRNRILVSKMPKNSLAEEVWEPYGLCGYEMLIPWVQWMGAFMGERKGGT